ncbi:MAG: Gfo/Idh/MocA family oxidoreductase [Bacteroidales bacterium]|nr:Gfo/Idh/MocA family oxidoreductase [Bacteroidales bacterium]
MIKKSKVRWGILSTAKIGREKVIPAMQKSNLVDILGISSRDSENAKEIAASLGIAQAYGSYEELINDPEIEAIYNPLPNHMHLEWSLKAIDAGKHVLCEKPIGMNSKEAETLIVAAKKNPELKVMEAFMYRFHPQWQKTLDLVQNGSIGKVQTIHSFFSYYNVDPENIRNRIDAGGGALMDIGCYCISFPRFLLGREPVRVSGIMDPDPVMKTDRLSSGILDFSDGITSSFSCSTQLMPYQRTQVHGTDGRIEIEIPVNAPPDKVTRIWLHNKKKTEEIAFEAVDQYTLQAEYFSKAILENSQVPIPLEDAVNNMKVIDAFRKSAESGTWTNM